MDELMLRKARGGDPEAFEALMTPLEGLVWRVCWHYLGNREDASDCGQETMLRIWRSLGSYRGDCAFESWIYRIAANVCLDLLRKRGREKQVPLEPMREQGYDPPDPAPGTEEQAVSREEGNRLRRLIAALPEEQRDPLVMTQLEGLSYAEAAALLGVSEGTVKSRVNRAKARLKEQLAPARSAAGQLGPLGKRENAKSEERRPRG